MKKILILIFLFFSPALLMACNSLTFIKGSALPSSLTIGQSYTVRCDYGTWTNAINPIVSGGACVYGGYLGTSIFYNCTAPLTAQTVTVSCSLITGTSYNQCAQKNPINSVTVTAPLPPTMTTTYLYPGLTCASSKVCNGNTICLNLCKNVPGGVQL